MHLPRFYRILLIGLSAIMVLSIVLSSCKPAAPATTETTATTEAATTEAATTEAAGEKYKIGVLAADYNDKWNTYLYRAMQSYADEIKDTADVTIIDGENNYEKQVSQAESFIAQGIDALVLQVVNNMVNSPIVGMAKNANIPLITVNSILLDEDQAQASCYVGSDSVVGGELEMGYLAKQANGKGKVAILMGELTHECAVKRTKGYENVMAGYPDLVEVARDATDWSRDKAQTIMENWITAGIDFDIVTANNDEGAIGAILGMESQNVDPKPYLIGGIDATPDALQYLHDGKLDVTVYQDPNAQGKGAIEAAIKILKGEEVDKIIWIPFELVTPADYDKYQAKWEE